MQSSAKDALSSFDRLKTKEGVENATIEAARQLGGAIGTEAAKLKTNCTICPLVTSTFQRGR